MKAKKNWLKLTMAIVGALFLIGVSSAAQAAEVIFDPKIPNKAIGITDLNIGDTIVNVDFMEGVAAVEVYGEPPGEFDFVDQVSAGDAVDAVNAALNASMEPVRFVGQRRGSIDTNNMQYYIGYFALEQGVAFPLAKVSHGKASGATWGSGNIEELFYFETPATWALFTFVSTEVKISGRVIHLEGDGLILQNNGDDDLPITGNGDFTFDTPLASGDTYEVTVLQDPSNRDQTCSVFNSRGTVANEDVTNEMLCSDPVTPPADDRVFVTSHSILTGNLGGLTGADDKCQAAADAAGLGGGPWTAWLSDSTGDAIDRIPNGRYRLLDDTLVALNKDDLVTGKLMDAQTVTYLRNPINIDEFGQDRSDEWLIPWTGTLPHGMGGGHVCNDWTDNTAEASGTVGDSRQIDDRWTIERTDTCNDSRSLYCFGEPAPVDPCACDLNNDGACDWVDLLEFFSDWGRTDCNEPEVEPCECDLNNDGVCDNQDFSIFEEDWGRTDCPVE